jgi:hypothetical protein
MDSVAAEPVDAYSLTHTLQYGREHLNRVVKSMVSLLQMSLLTPVR